MAKLKIRNNTFFKVINIYIFLVTVTTFNNLFALFGANSFVVK